MQPLLLTLLLMGVSIAIAVPLGMSLAMVLLLCGRSALGRVVQACGVVVLLVLICLPMYVHAAAWEATAGKYGWIPLMQVSANQFWFRGLLAAGWIHGVSGAAWVALATLWGHRRIPESILQQASLEASPLRRLIHVEIPLTLPSTIAATLWVALLAATEMTVADLYGVRTLADEVYLKYAFDPEWVPIALACLLPMIVAVPLIGIVRWVIQPQGARISDALGMRVHTASQAAPAGMLETIAAVTAALLLAGIVAVPLLSLFVKAGLLVQPAGQAADVDRYGWSFARLATTMGESFQTFGAEYFWTGVLAVAVTVVAVPCALVAAAWAEGARWRANLGGGVALASVLLPGPVVGMLVLHAFHNNGEMLNTLYQRSIVPTVIALLPRALPAAYFVLRVGFRMLDTRVDEAASSDGATSFQRWLRIDVPRLKVALVVAGFAAAVVATADVPATLVVLPPGISTVGTRLFSLLHSGVRYQAAGLALTFSVGIASLLLMLHAFLHRRTRRRVG